MFIKEITICGFKSYSDTTTITDLSNELNVIVGRNGSGKSNVFAAIEFVLTLEYRYMKAEARSALISQGRSPTDPSYVEIVFDNSDRKLPVDANTVSFKRVLATKKDRLFVNGKEIHNVKQFVDIAGFTNPYFIVKQGKVHDLALATDSTRLKVISDVTGTSIYDNKIADCKKYMQAAEVKRKEIEAMMEELNERKESLETEVSGQKLFMKLDQSKRGLEFVIHERKLKEIQANLTDLETKRKEANVNQDPVKSELEKTTRELQIHRRDLGEIEERINQLQELKKDYENTRNEIASNLESQKQELQDRQSRSANSETSAMELDGEIAKTKEQLAKADKELAKLKQPFEDLCNEKCQLDVRVKFIQEKEVGKDKFKKISDYREHVTKKIRAVAQSLKDNNEMMKTYLEAENTAKENLLLESEQNQMLRDNLSSCWNEMRTINQQVEQHKTLQCTTKGRLDVVHRDLGETEQKLAQKRERVARLEEECKKSIGSDIFLGWVGVRTIVEDFKLSGRHAEIVDGYYGLAFEIIQCESKLDLAVEAAAGIKLVNHVVQSKLVAEVILREFNRRQLRGEVHFMPIDSLREKNTPTTPDALRGAKPIIELLQFDGKFCSVIQFIFGSTLLCANLEMAAQMMRQYKVQCVTMEGEKISKVGVMTGGSIRYRPQKLELQRARTVDEKDLAKYSDRKVVLDTESSKLREEYKTTKQQYEQLRLQKANLERTKLQLLGQIDTSDSKMSALKQIAKAAEEKIQDTKLLIAELEEKTRVLESSDTDRAEATERFRIVSTEYAKVEKDYANKHLAKASLETILQQLYRQYYKIVEMSSQNEKEANENVILRVTKTMKSLSEQVSQFQAKLDKTVNDLATLQKSAARKQGKIDTLAEKEASINEQLMTLCATLESHASKYIACQAKLQEHNEASANLGSVPVNLEQYEELSDKELYSKLKKVNMKLKSSAKVGINQKAVQQYEELTAKYEEFEERVGKYRADRKELATLLKDLESKKGEAMLKNVRVLQEQFQKIFCSIVPKGNAELILYGPSTTINQEVDIENDELREMAGQNLFEGVKVAVNFIAKQLHHMRSLVQLSGGQKSVIAMCLILAIQTIDPVPFYLFDEVDQALDVAYRESVARVISNMAESSQFICTTFRKEFVDVASKSFGVSFQQRRSIIQQITDTQALNFIESDSSEESQSEREGSVNPNGA